jgi:predicted Na+-dependent transporter
LESLAASRHLALAAVSILTAPIVLTLLGHLFGFPTLASPGAIALRVFVSLFLPFGIGVALRAAVPSFTARVRKGLSIAGTVALLGVLVFLVVGGRNFFREFGARDYGAMALFCGLALACGHLMAPRADARITYALESAARNLGVALFWS